MENDTVRTIQELFAEKLRGPDIYDWSPNICYEPKNWENDMKGISFSTEIDLKGPLLLDRKSLEELDSIIETSYENACRKSDAKYDETVEKRFHSYHPNAKDWSAEKISERNTLVQNNFDQRRGK